MVKQTHSDMQVKGEDKMISKFNKTTIFLTRFLFGTSFESIKKCGFINSYTSDPDKMEMLNIKEDQRLLFLLFKNKKLSVEDISNIVKVLCVFHIKILFTYELINDYSMVVLEFPKNYISDFDKIIEGRYSKLSNDFKKEFPETKPVYNNKNQEIGKEYTIYYHIFNKTAWLKEYWMKKLNLVELNDGVELWQPPDKEDLVFNSENILKQL